MVEKQLIRNVRLETWQSNHKLEYTNVDFIDIGCADMKIFVVLINGFFTCHLPILAFSQLPYRK
jgi:hypothetical protein